MKKSMFMSTVAMIIVVVVAMSTATFAWFSTFTSVSSTTNIEIKAQGSGVETREVVYGATDPNHWTKAQSGWSTWSDQLSPMIMTQATMAAPQTDILFPNVTTINYSESTGSAAAITQFYAAQQQKTTNKITRMTNNALSNMPTSVGFKEFQVKKTGKSENIKLVVTISSGEEVPSEATKYAIDTTKIVIVAVQGITTATAAPRVNEVVIGEKFNYGFTGGVETWAPNGVIVDTKLGVGSETPVANKGTATTLANNAAVVDATTFQDARVSGDVIDFIGTNKVFNHTWKAVPLGGFDSFITFRAYIWNDGHFGTSVLGGGKVKIDISFTTSPIV